MKKLLNLPLPLFYNIYELLVFIRLSPRQYKQVRHYKQYIHIGGRELVLQMFF